MGSEAIQFDRPTVSVVSSARASKDRHRNLSVLMSGSECDSEGRGHRVVLIPDIWMLQEAVDTLEGPRPTLGAE